jgi:hypothetical protein
MIWVYTVVSAGTALFLVAVVFKVGRAYLRRRRGDLHPDTEKIEQGVDSDADTTAPSSTSTLTTITTCGGTTTTQPLFTTPIRPPRIAIPPEAPKRERVQEPKRCGGGIAIVPMIICTVPVGVRTGVAPSQSSTASIVEVVDEMEEGQVIGSEPYVEPSFLSILYELKSDQHSEEKLDSDIAKGILTPPPVQTVQEPVRSGGDVVSMVIYTVPVDVCTNVEPYQDTTASIVEVVEEMEEGQVTVSVPYVTLSFLGIICVLTSYPLYPVRRRWIPTSLKASSHLFPSKPFKSQFVTKVGSYPWSYAPFLLVCVPVSSLAKIQLRVL